ncbi:hypothetical protein [Streptomyces californicus]|uniref:hypothetical protein n=1 Tax=Streptomyces californicus TaxID=67351 RepID=UPI003326C6B0
MWSPSLSAALDQHRVPRAALLKHYDGAELAVIEDPTPNAPAIPRVNPVDWWLKEASDSLVALARRAVPDAEPSTTMPDRPSLGTAASLSSPTCTGAWTEPLLQRRAGMTVEP